MGPCLCGALDCELCRPATAHLYKRDCVECGNCLAECECEDGPVEDDSDEAMAEDAWEAHQEMMREDHDG